VFDFNAFSGPLFPGFLQGIVFAIILFLRARREERISDVFAGLLLLAGSLFVAQWMLGFAGWYDGRDWRTTVMFYVEWKNLLAFGPLIWLYFRSLTNTDFRWEGRYWWHFLPLTLLLLPAVGIFLYDFGYYRLLKGEVFGYFSGTRGPAAEWDNSGGSVVSDVIYVLSAVHLMAYLFWTLRDYRKYRAYLEREFSNAEQLTFASLRFTLWLMLIGALLVIVLDVANIFFSQTYADSWDSFFVMSVFTFFAAVQFLAIDPRRTRALRFEPNQEIEPVKELKEEQASVTTPDDRAELESWAAKLESRLSTHEDHLNPDLKLGELAQAIKTNGSVLSRVINQVYGKNFNDYINARRCDAFVARIRAGDHERHTLLSIALDCGFNSKSTFNRAFKKATGKSPGSAVKEMEGAREVPVTITATPE